MVVIKGMEIPPDGRYTVCITHDSNGVVHWVFQNQDTLEFVKHGAVIEVPEPHGDLIDRQELLEDNKHLEYPTDGKYRRDRAWAVGFNAGAKHANEHVYYSKTIIPASEEG